MQATLPHANGHDVTLHICDSKDEEHFSVPRLATKRVHWPTGPVELCDPCAAWLLKIAEVLATHVHVEELPPPTPNPETRRGVSLEGMPRS